MEKEKFEPTPMPEVTQCETYEDFQVLAEKLDAEGFRIDRNMPNAEIQKTVEFYNRDPEIVEVKLSSAFTAPTPKNNYKGEPMPDYTCIWTKVEKKQ